MDKVQDIWFKKQRVLRTIFTTAAMLIPLAPQVIAIINGYWPTEVGGLIAVEAIALNGAFTALIALPAVNAFLVKFGLGSVPATALNSHYTVEQEAGIEQETDGYDDDEEDSMLAKGEQSIRVFSYDKPWTGSDDMSSWSEQDFIDAGFVRLQLDENIAKIDTGKIDVISSIVDELSEKEPYQSVKDSEVVKQVIINELASAEEASSEALEEEVTDCQDGKCGGPSSCYKCLMNSIKK